MIEVQHPEAGKWLADGISNIQMALFPPLLVGEVWEEDGRWFARVLDSNAQEQFAQVEVNDEKTAKIAVMIFVQTFIGYMQDAMRKLDDETQREFAHKERMYPEKLHPMYPGGKKK